MEMTPVLEMIRAALRGDLSQPTPLEMIHAMRPRGVSKHRRFDSDGNWIPGRVRIADNSSLRKLMRAARRDMLAGREQVVRQAMQNAARQPTLHMSSHQKAMHGLRAVLASRGAGLVRS